MATGIYYFSNAYYAQDAYAGGGTPNFTRAIYHEAIGNNLQDWSAAIVNGSDNGNPNYYTDASGNNFGWTIAYSDAVTSGTLAVDGTWIKSGLSIGTYLDPAPTLVLLCPAYCGTTVQYPDNLSPLPVVSIAIGVLSYNTGKTPITDTPDSITASGLTSGDGSSFYKTKYLSSGNWNVNVVLNPNSISGATTTGTIITPGDLVDSVASPLFTSNAVVYGVLQEAPAPPAIVSVLSYYENSTHANAGQANNDDLYGSSGATSERIAYCLASTSEKVIGTIDGGTLNGHSGWNLIDISGNEYSGNPLSNTTGIPFESPAWYLYPYTAPMIVSVFSYYANLTNANAGVANNDDLYGSDGASANRIAFYLASNSTFAIGDIEAGGDLGGITNWNLLDTSGNEYSGNPVANSSELPGGSLAWYLYPYSAPPSVTVSMSYYTNSTNATSGRTNNDGATISSVGGTSGNRIAYSENGSLIGDVDASGGSIGSYTSWYVIESNGNLLSGHYNNGVDKSTLGETTPSLYLYPYSEPGPAAPCFLEGSQILCLVDEKETYLPIEKMRKGTLVKTLNSGYKMVHIIGKRDIPNFNDSNRIKDRLYKLTSAQYPALTSDLYLTGCHSTLVDSLTEEQKEEIKKMLGVVCVTEGKYRLPSCLDNNAEPWQSKGTYTVWHFALDDQDPLINFGVYANGGLIVETGSIRYLQGKANMELV